MPALAVDFYHDDYDDDDHDLCDDDLVHAGVAGTYRAHGRGGDGDMMIGSMTTGAVGGGGGKIASSSRFVVTGGGGTGSGGGGGDVGGTGGGGSRQRCPKCGASVTFGGVDGGDDDDGIASSSNSNSASPSNCFYCAACSGWFLVRPTGASVGGGIVSDGIKSTTTATSRHLLSRASLDGTTAAGGQAMIPTTHSSNKRGVSQSQFVMQWVSCARVDTGGWEGGCFYRSIVFITTCLSRDNFGPCIADVSWLT